jgi:CubicO group peptidase (beta-lactamase class C family)
MITHPDVRRSLLAAGGIALAVLTAFWLLASVRSPAEVTLATWTEPAVPNTTAGRRFSAYLEVLNSGDQERLRRFVGEHFSPVGPGGGDINDRIASQVRFANISRGLNLYEVTQAEELAVSVTAQLRLTQEWRQITFMVEEEPPHLVSGVMIVPAEAPALARRVSRNDDEIAQQIDAYVQDLVQADRFSGVVLVARDGIPIFERAYGSANREQDVPNQRSTRFSIASAGKMFTAVAIAQLVEAGKLTYADTIDRHLSSYPAAAGQVTIDQLLTHRSGIVDFFADEAEFAKVKESLDPQRDYQPLFMDEPLRFVPGERFEYSNSNYILLGAIVEKVAGQSYGDYLRTHIFVPAGMTETSLSSVGIDGRVLARGYTELDTDGAMTPGKRRSAAAHEPAIASAAGGAYTTARDLLRFDQALRTHRLLSAAAADELLADRADYERPGYHYAYGFITRVAGDERVAGHSGGFPGVDAQFEMYLASGYTVIVLSNYEMVAEPILAYVQRLLPR